VHAPGFIAVLVIDLHFPDAGSLKAKRKELSSIKAQLQGRLGASVTEVAFQDLWQRARLVASVVSGSPGTLAAQVESIEGWLHARWPEQVAVERIVLSVADLREGFVAAGSAPKPERH
jgi:uncharacterized protein YlxP (DUF503 family)